MKKIVALALAAMLVLFTMTACGIESDSAMAAESRPMNSPAADYGYPEEGETFDQMAEDSQGLPVSSEGAAVSSERKVVKSASFTIETLNLEEALKALEAHITATGSYVQTSSRYGDITRGGASAEYTVRVPTERYEEFRQNMETLGNVTGSSEGGEDVTAQYFDTEARLKALQAQEERVLELFEKADNIEQMIQIEQELTRIRTEIEQLTTTLKRLDSLVSYSTVTVSLSQTEELTVAPLEDTFWNRLGESISNSLSTLLNGLQTLAVVLVWMLPYILIAGVILLVVVFAVKRQQKKHPTKKPSGYPPLPPNGLAAPQDWSQPPPPPQNPPTPKQ